MVKVVLQGRRTGPFPLPNDPDKHELSEKLIKLGRILARPGRGRKWDGALCLPWSDRPRSSSLDWQWSARKCFCDASFFGGGNHGVCGCDDRVVVVVAAMQGRRRGIEDGNGCTGGMRGRGGGTWGRLCGQAMTPFPCVPCGWREGCRLPSEVARGRPSHRRASMTPPPPPPPSPAARRRYFQRRGLRGGGRRFLLAMLTCQTSSILGCRRKRLAVPPNPRHTH